jgi:hypothetical protein
LVNLIQLTAKYPKKSYDGWDKLENYFKSINLFGGKEDELQEFSSKFKRCVKQGNRDVHEALLFVENNMTEEEMLSEDYEQTLIDGFFGEDMGIDEVKKWISETSAKIYTLLTMLTKGDANSVVSRVRGDNGLAVWRKLCNLSSPKTLAIAVVAMRNVQNPGQVSDPMKVEGAIDDWEDKIVKLENDFGEQMSYPMRIATLYGMVPKDMQDKL